MRVKSLTINNLRNILSAQIELNPCLNYFSGNNGAGKTSVLEALAVLSKGRSFRTGQILSVIGPDSKSFQVLTNIESQSGVPHQLGMKRGADYWSARHNGENVQQLSELSRLLPYVLLEPNSHTLVSGPPDTRRRYLDWGVFHVEPGFLTLWRRYNRVLKQRNAALKQSNSLVVGSLDPQFISLGEQLHQAREQQTRKLDQILQEKLKSYSQILEGVQLKYRKGWTGESLAEATRHSLSRDMEKGLTIPGPHKADLYLAIDGTPAKERLSRGEKKTLTAALIMSQAQLICESGEKPVLLLDDLSSELDEEHVEKVLNAGLELGAQIWVTGTQLSPVMERCETGYSLFHVEHGAISASGV